MLISLLPTLIVLSVGGGAGLSLLRKGWHLKWQSYKRKTSEMTFICLFASIILAVLFFPVVVVWLAGLSLLAFVLALAEFSRTPPFGAIPGDFTRLLLVEVLASFAALVVHLVVILVV